jgi:UDP-glucuronate decarboxylase
MKSTKENKKILIAGGAGFIGTNLIKQIINSNNQIFCFDNFFTGSRKNVIQFLKNKNFKVVNHDITKPLNLKVDQIWNLACPASPIHYQHDPVKTLVTSIQGSINLLNLAKKNNCKIFQASTSEIYGDPLIHPQKESYWGNVNPIGPRSCYDEGKRCAETLFFDYNREFKINIKVARIFNTYGPYMHPKDGRVVSNFIVQALNNKPITIYGNGKQTRSFCYVDDLVNGLIKLMNSKNSITGPINIGNNSELTVKKLAKIIVELTNSKSKIIYKNLPIDDPIKRKPDIKKAKKLLKWEPKTNLLEGLSKTIKYFETML